MTQKAHPFDPWTIALYGISNSGKSTQAALLAKYIFEQSGLKTRWYLLDDGDLPGEADPLVASGAIDKIDCRDIPHPFMAANNITKGMVPVVSSFDLAKDKSTGKWEIKPLDGIGLVVVDSGLEMAEKMFGALSQFTAQGINVGGEGAWNFKDGSTDWGETLMVGSSNKAHYGIVQTRMKDFITRLGQLAKRKGVMVLVTFGEDRGEQETTKQALIGPKTKGGAQTALIPGWFKFTFRTATKIDPTKGNSRVLYTDGHKDGGVNALANRRFPVSVDTSKVPSVYEPADVVKALLAYKEVTRGAK